MDAQANPARPSRWKRVLKVAGCVLAVLGVAGWWFVKSHPLIFEPAFAASHKHCIKQIGLALRVYANDHEGRFPEHPNGYGAALLLLLVDPSPIGGTSSLLTGPGYDGGVFDRALKTGAHVSESECGRVYVQGLNKSSNPEIAVVWDKLPTPGGEHCHGWPRRLRAPLCREVCLGDGSMQLIREANWPEFSKRQIELLVKEGIPRERAEALYAEKPKPLK